ncbi:hypothetical protein [Flavobacterium faecale]|uniref:hypothetical protein n=1 Tax=Flavobacterium faecale TaxID=1355330 RepID=UPI003AAD1B4A
MAENIAKMEKKREKFKTNDFVIYLGISSFTENLKEPKFAKIISYPNNDELYFCLEMVEDKKTISAIINDIRVIETEENILLKSNLFTKEEVKGFNVVKYYYNSTFSIYYTPIYGFYTTKNLKKVDVNNLVTPKEFNESNKSLYNINDVIEAMEKSGEYSTREVFKILYL